MFYDDIKASADVVKAKVNRKPAVGIILGSGLPLYEHNDPYLEDLGRVYWLRLSKEQLLQKIKKSKKHDWLRDEGSNIRIGEILKEREAAYARVANETIEADGMSVNEVAEAVIALATAEPKAEEKPAPKKKAAAKKAEPKKAEPKKKAASKKKAAEPADEPAKKPAAKKKTTAKKTTSKAKKAETKEA